MSAVLGASYAASSDDQSTAERFFLKPTALGKYLLFNSNSELLTATGPTSNTSLANATDANEWTFIGVGDTNSYPETPVIDIEPTPEYLVEYRTFISANTSDYLSSNFHLVNGGQRLTIDSESTLAVAVPGNADSQKFRFEEVVASECAEFPEADNNTVGQTFTGTQADGSVLGFADVHVHVSATTFLGGTHSGWPFHKFGVEHALHDCEEAHGPQGGADVVGAFLGNDFDGHATDGWPTFTDWPLPDSLTHESTYWKWVERAWLSGLRILVNDLVDNETLCELYRSAGSGGTAECNEMQGAADQVGTMYAMQDYIDAQYGGRGAGWFRIVLSPAEAREVIAQGKLAVVLGIEISHLFNCKVTYNTPLPGQETSGCALTKTGENGVPGELAFEVNRLWELGVRQAFPIHEFDNAIGGNGIFNDLVLNLGNREDTGGIPGGYAAALADPAAVTPTALLSNAEPAGGEFWSTYDCPDGGVGDSYLYSAGAVLQSIPPKPAPCADLDGGYPGGATACYPEAARQCNARWLTETGRQAFTEMMQRGMIIEVDHLELEIKSQLIELATEQDIDYPVVSTHGGHGGISKDQARAMLAGGGIIYPYKSNGQGHVSTFDTVSGLHAETGSQLTFAMGYGADTNGLGAQAKPRGSAGDRPVNYPFTLFSGGVWDTMPEFNAINGLQFQQPSVTAPNGDGQTWHTDIHGMAHYGMVADWVEEVRLEGIANGNAQDVLRGLFNSAEVYLQMWERTLSSSEQINKAVSEGGQGGVKYPAGLMRQPPVPTPATPLPAAP